MPTSPLKRPSSGGGGGRLRRLLASLRPPARAGPLPVQTGFPTSLADIVVKNHGRFRNPRRRHRAGPAPAPAPAAAAVSQQRRELSVAHDAAARAPVTARPGKAAELRIRPELLAAGGAVALVLLVVWSKQLVAAATLASVALSWIESARAVGARRPETEQDELDSRRRRGRVSPIREAAELPRPSCAVSEPENGGSDAAWLWSAGTDTSDLGGDVSSLPANNNNTRKPKQRARSLRELLASKLRNGGKTPRGKDSRHGVDAGDHPETPRRLTAAAGAPAEATLPVVITGDDRRQTRRRRGFALPLPALVPIILAGLVAGKLPALALAVLCAAFSCSAESVPVPDSGGPSPR